jgi:hypothetical protein
MSVLSSGAQKLIAGAADLAKAAQRLAEGKSPFGRYLVPGLIPAQGLSVAYGPTGVAKSFLAVRIGLSVAAGSQWGGQQLERGVVAFLASEDRYGIEARAVVAAAGLELGDIPFEIMTPQCIHADRWTEDLAQALELLGRRHDLPVRLVILDTLGGAFGDLSQNDDGPMSRATGNLINLSVLAQCAVLATHHSGKDADRGHRGSQVLEDRADAFIRMRRVAGGRIEAAEQKMRNGTPGANVSFRLAPCDLRIGERTVSTMTVAEMTFGNRSAPETEANEPRSTSKLTKDATTSLRALQGLCQANGETASIEAWRDATYAAFGARKQDAKRQAFNLARKRLVEGNRVVISDDSVRIQT